MNGPLTPPPEREFPAGRLQQRKEQLVSQLYGASAAPTPHHPRRILVLAAALAIAGILAAAAYAGYALTRSATPVATIGCYESDSLNANTSVLCLRYGFAGRSLCRHLRVGVPGLAAAREFRRLRAPQRLDRCLPERRR